MTSDSILELINCGYTILKKEEHNELKEINDNLLRERINQILREEGEYAGFEGKEEYIQVGKQFEPKANRISNLGNKGKIFREIACLDCVNSIISNVIRSEYKISSINMREPMPGNLQDFHIDWIPRNKESDLYTSFLAFYYVDSVTIENGPTAIIPKSHTWLGWPNQSMSLKTEEQLKSINITADAGDLLIFNSNLIHRGTINKSLKSRKAIVVTYRSRNMPQQLNQKRYISPKTLNSMNDRELYLFALRENDEMQDNLGIGAGQYMRKDGITRSDADEDM